MQEERLRELNRYVETLLKLKHEGFKCDSEIQTALKDLHKEMGFEQGANVIKLFKDTVLSNKDKLIVVDDRHRGIGKTTAILEMAKELNLPIFKVGDIQSDMESYLRLEENINIKVIRRFRVSCGKTNAPNGVLIDEDVDYETIKMLKGQGVRIRGGFYTESFLKGLF